MTTKGRKPPETSEGTIFVGSIYGFKADMPLVEIEMAGFMEPKAQLTLAQAQEFHRHLGEAIETAQSDAFIVRFFRETVGLEQNELGALLIQFREFRKTMNRPGGRSTIVVDG